MYIPLTFMDGFYAGAELRRLMATFGWPDTVEYRDLLDAYRRAFQDTSRGTRVADASSLGHEHATADSISAAYDGNKLVLIKRTLYKALLRWTPPEFTSFYAHVDDSRPRISPYVHHVQTISHLGLTFGTRQHSKRNSFIMFTHPDTAVKTAGQIADIVLHARVENNRRVVAAFVVVDVYADLTSIHARADPYRAFTALDTRLYYNYFQSQVLIKLDDVVAHFAALNYTPAAIGVECIVARSLDRVSPSLAILQALLAQRITELIILLRPHLLPPSYIPPPLPSPSSVIRHPSSVLRAPCSILPPLRSLSPLSAHCQRIAELIILLRTCSLRPISLLHPPSSVLHPLPVPLPLPCYHFVTPLRPSPPHSPCLIKFTCRWGTLHRHSFVCWVLSIHQP